MEDVEQVTAEFTQRLSESEKLCQQAIRVSYLTIDYGIIDRDCQETEQGCH